MKIFFLKHIDKIFIFVLIAISVISGFFWNRDHFGFEIGSGGDEMHYHKVALEYLDKGEFSSYKSDVTHARVDPLYPYFISLVYRIGVDYDLVRCFQLVIFVLTVLLIFSFVKEFINKYLAFILTVFYAVSPFLAKYVGVLYKEVLFSFLVLLFVVCLKRAFCDRRVFYYFCSFVLFVFVFLTNSVILMFLPFLFIGTLFYVKGFSRVERVSCALFWVWMVLFLVVVYFCNSEVTESNNNRGASFINRKAEMMRGIEQYSVEHFVGVLLGYYFVEDDKEEVDPYLFLSHGEATRIFREKRGEGCSYSEVTEELYNGVWEYFFRRPDLLVFSSVLDFLQLNTIEFDTGPVHNMFIRGGHSEIPRFVKIFILLVLRFINWLVVFLVFVGVYLGLRGDYKKFLWPVLMILFFNIIFALLFGLPRYLVPVHCFYLLFLGVCLEYLGSLVKKFCARV